MLPNKIIAIFALVSVKGVLGFRLKLTTWVSRSIRSHDGFYKYFYLFKFKTEKDYHPRDVSTTPFQMTSD